MHFRIEVTVWRGPIAESRHRVHAALEDAGGLARATGDGADPVTTFRSAAKPFQLLPLVERGHAERLGFSDTELAVMASSHTGSALHVALVQGVLDRLGLSEKLLRCGYHEPLDPGSRERLAAHPEERNALFNNCSGKHAAMLALAQCEGWSLDDYHRPDHPLQQLMRRTIAEVCGVAPDAVAVAVDGCSVSVFGVPLSRMARAYALLGIASGEGDARQRAMARIRGAMQAHPVAAGGEGRFSTALMEALPGRLVAKGGAEGLECVAIPASRLGLAVKCEDGQGRAVAPAVVALLEQLGAIGAEELARVEEWRRPRLVNHAGLEVGRLEARILAPAHAPS